MAKKIIKKRKTTKKKRSKKKKEPNLLASLFIGIVIILLVIIVPEKIGKSIKRTKTLPKKEKQAKTEKTIIKKGKTIQRLTSKQPPKNEFDYYKSSLFINGNLHRYFRDNSISKSMVSEIYEEKKEDGKTFLYTTFSIKLNKKLDLKKAAADIEKIVQDNGGKIESTYNYYINKRDIITFYVSSYDKITHFFSISKSRLNALIEGNSPLISIIIDDCGYLHPKHFHYLEGRENIDLSILPYTPYVEETIKFANKNNNEVMLHLPLEPENSSQATDKGMIKTFFKYSEIISTFNNDLGFVPVAVGFNNHKGSKATSDKRIMDILMRYIKNKDLFFVDSRTTAKSIGYETARAYGIPTIKRDVFLDNKDEEAYIINQFHNLFKIAYLKGYAIGICHFRKGTIKAFDKVFDEINALNIRVVPVSYIIENEKMLSANGTAQLPDKLKELMHNIEED